MGFSYVKKKAVLIAAHGTGNPDWDRPLTSEDYEAQRRFKNSDISIERISFRDPDTNQEHTTNEPGKVR